jgi:SAM-dependent methyltransferase
MDATTAPSLASAPAAKRQPPSLVSIFKDLGIRLPLVAVAMAGILSVLCFPYSTDAPLTAAEQADLRKFYATAYEKPTGAEANDDSAYVEIAEGEANKKGVTPSMVEFVNAFGLSGKKVLDIGAGRGYLQDLVADYTALDISPSVRRFFHKPFVLASDTLMPFADNQFDAAWSIWVLEHVPNPEAALVEMRRVVKDGGLVYLAPAFDCKPWLANGYPVRPYSDFGLGGKLLKASIPVQSYFWNLSKAPLRLLFYASWKTAGGPTKLHYRRLTPNYDHYWLPDSDAVNLLDRHETALWFLSRGDECLNCEGALQGWFQENDQLIIRVHKH